jgi:hypothetical protein
MFTWFWDQGGQLWVLLWPLIRDWWMWVAGVVLVLRYGLRLIEIYAIAKFRTVEGVKDGWDWQKWARSEFWRRREWERFRDITDARYANLIQRKRQRADKWHQRAQILIFLADRAAVSLLTLPFYAGVLRRQAEKHEAASAAIYRKIERWDLLRRQIKEARDKIMREEGREKVIGLMELLRSTSETTASYALRQLNEVRNKFDWSILIPSSLPAAVRDQMKKILLVMAGTENVGEARAAFGQAMRILGEHRTKWGPAA